MQQKMLIWNSKSGSQSLKLRQMMQIAGGCSRVMGLMTSGGIATSPSVGDNPFHPHTLQLHVYSHSSHSDLFLPDFTMGSIGSCHRKRKRTLCQRVRDIVEPEWVLIRKNKQELSNIKDGVLIYTFP